jgi:hypothetical protein
MYEFFEIEPNVYEFNTKNGLIYSVYFIPAKDLYFKEEPNFTESIYIFGFDLITNTNQKLKYDPNISSTIIEILKTFFKLNNPAILFICDVNDNRQRQRKVAFNKWFKKYNESLNFIKLNKEFYIDNENQYYMSLIFNQTNPDRVKIQEVFFKITSSLDK